MSARNPKIVKTNCELCPKYCGIIVYIEDDRVVKIEGMRNHPVNKGALCTRAAAIRELLYHPDRLKYPLKRVGSWS